MHAFLHVLFLFFVLVSFIYLIYILIHLVGWNRIPESKIGNTYSAGTKISVIIAARNEETEITKCIEALSLQTYPAHLFEIIVVNDHSTDKTRDVAEKALSQLKISSKVISNGEDEHGKKMAITKAIKMASGELIVITDADCQSSPKWLTVIESEYQRTGAYMLCGPVQISGETNFLGRFQKLELDGFSLLSGAGIKIGVPLLCSGANIAYTRKLFEDIEGFKGIDKHPTGDDVLLMFKVHEKYPGKVGFLKSNDALVSTSAPESLKGFFSQRIRWGSKGVRSNNFANSFVSMLVFNVNLFSVLAILLTIVRWKLYPLLILGIATKVMADFLLLFFATDFFRRKRLLLIFPFAEMLTMTYISCVGIAANFSSYSWKDRQYNRPV